MYPLRKVLLSKSKAEGQRTVRIFAFYKATAIKIQIENENTGIESGWSVTDQAFKITARSPAVTLIRGGPAVVTGIPTQVLVAHLGACNLNDGRWHNFNAPESNSKSVGHRATTTPPHACLYIIWLALSSPSTVSLVRAVSLSYAPQPQPNIHHPHDHLAAVSAALSAVSVGVGDWRKSLLRLNAF
uniref:HDC12945 n=1 Tax=Drosophila melanogaster TaxID=7227 RepID=Q6IKB9_DROME|nr:TPA_inf: HDC12945 [Drosophila melanogaster]